MKLHQTVRILLCCWLLLKLNPSVFAQKKERDKSMSGLINKNLAFAAAQYKILLNNTPADSMPRSFNAQTGKQLNSDIKWWCSGFYPGTLWYIYEGTQDAAVKKEAEKRLSLLTPMQYFTGNHDLGFMMFCSFGNAYRITHDASYKAAVLNAAKSLATRYRPSIKAIQSWDSSKYYKCPVIIDNMMNLELLEWASRNGEGKNIGDIAVDHANTTLKNQFRPDYSSWHVIDYNLGTGQAVRKTTAQGAADSSAWSRGQGWALYGYTMMYRFTRDTAYLSLARHIAQFILNNSQLPEDKVPYWDFSAPGIPNALRDVSAAAIYTSALLELGQYTSGNEKQFYIDASKTILHSLSTDTYRANLGENGGFLLKHSVGSVPHKVEVDVPLTYADYYFVEALMRYKKWYLNNENDVPGRHSGSGKGTRE